MKTIYITIIILFILFVKSAQAQVQNFVGFNFTVEQGSNNFRPGAGLHFERKMTKRSGLETGIYYRNYVQNGTISMMTPGGGGYFLPFTVAERHISMPLLYKFYSRIVNLHVGTTFDFFTGWKQINQTSLVEVQEYSIDPSFALGAMLKISKQARISEKISLEPEIRINPIFSTGRIYAGLGILTRYAL